MSDNFQKEKQKREFTETKARDEVVIRIFTRRSLTPTYKDQFLLVLSKSLSNTKH